MAMLTYKEHANGHIEVSLDGKKVARIRRTLAWSGFCWQYFLTGQARGGEPFQTLELCKRSLEEFCAICESCPDCGSQTGKRGYVMVEPKSVGSIATFGREVLCTNKWHEAGRQS